MSWGATARLLDLLLVWFGIARVAEITVADDPFATESVVSVVFFVLQFTCSVNTLVLRADTFSGTVFGASLSLWGAIGGCGNRSSALAVLTFFSSLVSRLDLSSEPCN